MRQLLTESLLQAAIGAGLGVLASYGILTGIRVLLPPYAFAPEVVIRINIPVLLFSIGVGLATGVLFGLWPALQLSRTPAGQLMGSNVRRFTGSVAGRRANGVLIAGQVALTLLLLAGAGAAMEAFVGLMHRQLGYDPHNVMSVGIPLHDGAFTTWASRAAYFEQLRAKVAETPMSRSEEHTSELQSQSNLVCRLLLEKKNILIIKEFRASSALHSLSAHTSPLTKLCCATVRKPLCDHRRARAPLQMQSQLSHAYSSSQ